MSTSIWAEQASAQQAPFIRIQQIDVLRGFALLGIYWINVVVFGLPSGSYALPTLVGHAEQANVAAWAFSELFVEGTMRGLFSMLFGASAMIFLNEARLAGDGVDIVDRYYRRTLLLVCFGMLHAYFLLWPYDVLYVYGLLGMFLFPLRKLRAGLLITLGCLLLLIGDMDPAAPVMEPDEPVAEMATGLNKTMREAIQSVGALEDVNHTEVLRETMDEHSDEDKDRYLAGYGPIFRAQIDSVIEMESSYVYTTYVFDVGGMMLIGMALLKLGVLAGLRSTRFYLLLMVLGYLTGSLVRGVEVVPALLHNDFLRGLADVEMGYNLGRLPITLGHIGLVGLLCRTPVFNRLTGALANVGRLALSNYIMQTLLSIFIFYGFGFGLFGAFERYQLLLVCFAVWAFQVGFSIVWLRRFRHGPLEWVWRSLIYGQVQPLRKA